MQTNEARALAIASKVEDLVDTSGGYAKAEMTTFALNLLQEAYRAGADSIRNSPDYSYREDMGR